MKIIVTYKAGALFEVAASEITVIDATKMWRPEAGKKYWWFETVGGETLWINEDVVATVSSRED